MRFFFRWEWLTSNAHMIWPVLSRLGVGRKYARQAAEMLPSLVQPGAGQQRKGRSTATKPDTLPILQSSRELRTDHAHAHHSSDKPAATKKPN